MSVDATPQRWTPFHGQAALRRVIQTSLRLWDDKHQVLETPRVPAWRVFLWVKLIEVVLPLRPHARWRMFGQPDPELRPARPWYTAIGRGVRRREFADARRFPARPSPTMAAFGGAAHLPEPAHQTHRAGAAR